MRTLVIGSLLLGSLMAEPFVIVTHPSSPIERLSTEQAKAIYLKKRRFWKETKLTVLSLPPEAPLRGEFEQEILHMTPQELENYWMAQHYKGVRPPYRVESIQSMLLFVTKVEGAVGYLPKSAVTKDVKVIYESASR